MMTNAHRDRHPIPTRQRLQPPPRFSRRRAELQREALEDLATFTAAGRLDMARETRAHLEALEMREALEALEEEEEEETRT